MSFFHSHMHILFSTDGDKKSVCAATEPHVRPKTSYVSVLISPGHLCGMVPTKTPMCSSYHSCVLCFLCQPHTRCLLRPIQVHLPTTGSFPCTALNLVFDVTRACCLTPQVGHAHLSSTFSCCVTCTHPVVTAVCLPSGETLQTHW